MGVCIAASIELLHLRSKTFKRHLRMCLSKQFSAQHMKGWPRFRLSAVAQPKDSLTLRSLSQPRLCHTTSDY